MDFGLMQGQSFPVSITCPWCGSKQSLFYLKAVGKKFKTNCCNQDLGVKCDGGIIVDLEEKTVERIPDEPSRLPPDKWIREAQQQTMAPHQGWYPQGPPQQYPMQPPPQQAPPQMQPPPFPQRSPYGPPAHKPAPQPQGPAEKQGGLEKFFKK